MVKTNLFDLSGKVALVTGGASGIGKAIAAVLVQHGARVMIGSRTRQKVDEAARELACTMKPVALGDLARGAHFFDLTAPWNQADG